MKLHIFGASGAGVTTTGVALGEILGIPYLDSDFYFWEQTPDPYTVRRNPITRNKQLEADTSRHTSWILGGSVFDWQSAVSNEFTLAVFLWIPPVVRIERLKARELQRFGTIIHTDPQRNKQFNDFIDWASGYDDGTARGRTLQAHEKWMGTLPCYTLQLRGDMPLELRLQNILNYLQDSSPA
jgi:adenylate kinase family enzyme